MKNSRHESSVVRPTKAFWENLNTKQLEEAKKRKEHEAKKISNKEKRHQRMANKRKETMSEQLNDQPLKRLKMDESLAFVRTNGNDDRSKVVDEIYISEYHYLQNLRLLLEKFANPLKEEGLLSLEEQQTLFGTVEAIFPINFHLLEELQGVISHWQTTKVCVGDIFIRLAPFFKAYKSYCSIQDKRSSLLQRLIADNSSFRSFVQAVEEKLGDTLQSFLIQPVQRIPRYQLLLEQLLRKTPNVHPDYHHIENAILEIRKVLDYLNDDLKQEEAKRKVNEIAAAFDTSLDTLIEPLEQPHRRFISEGVLFATPIISRSEDTEESESDVQDKNEENKLYYFVFTDWLLFARKIGIGLKKKFSLENQYELHLTVLKDHPKGSELHIEVVNPKNTTVVLAPSLKDKEEFISIVNKTIETLLESRPTLKEQREKGLRIHYDEETESWAAEVVHQKFCVQLSASDDYRTSVLHTTQQALQEHLEKYSDELAKMKPACTPRKGHSKSIFAKIRAKFTPVKKKNATKIEDDVNTTNTALDNINPLSLEDEKSPNGVVLIQKTLDYVRSQQIQCPQDTVKKDVSSASKLNQPKQSAKKTVEETSATPTPKRNHKHTKSTQSGAMATPPSRDVGTLVTQPVALFNNDIDLPTTHKKTRITSGKWSIRKVDRNSKTLNSNDRLNVIATPRPTVSSFVQESPSLQSPKFHTVKYKSRHSERARSVNFVSPPISNFDRHLDAGPPPNVPPPPLPSTPIPPPLFSEELANSPVSPQLVQLISGRQSNRTPKNLGRIRTHERRNTVGEVPPPDVPLPAPIAPLLPPPPPPPLSSISKESAHHVASPQSQFQFQPKKRKSFSHTPGMIAILEEDKENSPDNSPIRSRKSVVFPHLNGKQTEVSVVESGPLKQNVLLTSPKSKNRKVRKSITSRHRVSLFPAAEAVTLCARSREKSSKERSETPMSLLSE
jgi:hypothetical protein